MPPRRAYCGCGGVFMQMEQETKEQETFLSDLITAEEIGEKKMKIYSRLLMDAALAEDMETLAFGHEERKNIWQQLLTRKPVKKQNGGGRSALNEEEEEK